MLAALAVPVAVVALPTPAAAQFTESYKFLEAVRKKDGAEVTKLLDEGGPNLINTRDYTTGESALHIVTNKRDLTWMRFLVGKGANVNARDSKGMTPLVVAVNYNFVEGAEFLIGQSARLDESNNAGETPLITAVHNHNLDIMRVLLTAGADPDRADNSGRSARDYALYEGKEGALIDAIQKYAKPKKKDGQGPKVFGPSF
jgi:ankyrin repeat protein